MDESDVLSSVRELIDRVAEATRAEPFRAHLLTAIAHARADALIVTLREQVLATATRALAHAAPEAAALTVCLWATAVGLGCLDGDDRQAAPLVERCYQELRTSVAPLAHIYDRPSRSSTLGIVGEGSDGNIVA